MQQTEKYKLNLIESSDPFLPEGLNANTQKVEEVLSENLGAMQGTVEALVADLGTGETNARVCWGSYTGNGKYGKDHPCSLAFDFCPLLIIVSDPSAASSSDDHFSVLIRGAKSACSSNGGVMSITWLDQGVQWFSSGSNPGSQNNYAKSYYYVAVGCDVKELNKV